MGRDPAERGEQVDWQQVRWVIRMQKAHEDLNRHGLATGPLVPGEDDPEEESAFLAGLRRALEDHDPGDVAG